MSIVTATVLQDATCPPVSLSYDLFPRNINVYVRQIPNLLRALRIADPCVRSAFISPPICPTHPAHECMCN